MVLTYQEAVGAAAAAIYNHEESSEFNDELLCDDCGEVMDPDDLTRDQASHQAVAVLSAVGYADLLAEVERLRDSVRGYRTRLADAMGRWITADAEVARLTLLASRWQEIVSAPSFEAAVNAAAQSYHETECAYGRELTALREAVVAVARDWERNAPDRIVGEAVAHDFRAALEQC